VLQLNSIEIKKATEERTSGEGQTPFRKRAKGYDLVNIFHRERIAKGKAPIDEISLLKQTPQH
jgi:hypothetical protein